MPIGIDLYFYFILQLVLVSVVNWPPGKEKIINGLIAYLLIDYSPLPLFLSPLPFLSSLSLRMCLTGDEADYTEDSWNSNIGIVHKTRYGYYCYPQ